MEDLQSTARWANRVLRPLTSICRRIEKHQKTLSMIATESRQQEAAQEKPAVDTGQKTDRGDIFSTSEADDNDPVWVPGKKPERRRARHKYSSRGEGNGGKRCNRLSLQSPEAPRTLPGAIELATPLITGRRWEMPSSAQSQGSVDRSKPIPHPAQQQAFRDRYSLYKSPWQELLDESGDPTFADIAHNLDRVFQNFLFNTQISKREANPVAEKVNRGARSLMSMLVRRLPEFIAIEQKAQDELDEDGDEDMCDAYFTELETFYAPHGSGWKPLREAVRAQGIYLVASMIQNHWVTDAIACALIEKCHSCAPDACQSLLSTILSTRTTYPYPNALKSPDQPSSSGDPVRLLRKYAHHGVAPRSFIFDELAKLLSRGVLPPEWMATKPWTVWVTRATISFSKQDDDCDAASRLIEAVILSASDVRSVTAAQSSQRFPTRRKTKSARSRDTRASSIRAWQNPHLAQTCPLQVEEALSNHVISLMAAMCGMHISRSRASDDTERSNGTKPGHIIRYITLALQRDMDLKPLSQRPDLTPHQLLRRGCILLGTSIVQCNDTILSDDTPYMIPSTTSIDECARTIVSRTDMIKEMAFFVKQAFRCFKTGTETEHDRVSEDIRCMIYQLSRLADRPGLSSFLGQVAAESAMVFAEATDDPEDHVWAIGAQETVVTIQSQKESEEGSEENSEFEESTQNRSLFRWEESIDEWVACTPVTKAKPILVQKSSRPFMRMLSSPVHCIPCSEDSSSSSTDSFADYISSVTSSPSSVAAPLPMAPKRTFEDTDSVQLPPRKRQRPAPFIVFDNEESSEQRWSPSPNRYNFTVEPVSRRMALRERRNVNMRMPPAKQGNKVEVVIINNRETRTRQDAPRPALERGEKQIHRTVERRRPARSPIPPLSRSVRRPTSQPVIPCSQDEDSDDELSFL
ncbi:hypothetical protein N7499_009965 [Penicillium canescens]|uniref:Uncharacterized protein n=1 Tax=Penicillium canescens TaxID=5083 RepID=A0AAD6NDL2_PENCN|nr:uncharacterized protein N7446_008017 [Penicillium canescens]KAJ6033689.1 hypothetical protein N7444_011460 [Penicillium canescens]KAJ6057118.1 hypothetical protein N7460_000392 [Penicillium canescens]KAJ6058434.1 hypothetical protein N7446_008017 [Penicillium canescens]KAJ6071951.1 hypothetical protein N7499_009965 [Penicillium canescens]KAJ6170629.1 hypothetical protein N7485_007975 [Penicillium canescens]